MYEDIVKEIQNYENQLKASITTYNTIMKLKNLKLEDAEKEISKARKDDKISNEELFAIYQKRDELLKEMETEKAKIDFDNVKEEYNMLKERHLYLVKKYKEIVNKKEKATNEYIIGELNKDAAYVIQSLESLIIPFSNLNDKANQKEKEEAIEIEEKPEVIQIEIEPVVNDFEEKRIISNNKDLIKEKIQVVQENIGRPLRVVEEPITGEFKLKKGPATYQEFVDKGFAEPDKNRPFRRIVKAIKNKLAEWRKKGTIVSEENLLEKEVPVQKVEPIIASNVIVPEEQILNEPISLVNDNSNVALNSIVSEEQLLNLGFSGEQGINQEKVQPIYEEVLTPEVNQNQGMNLEDIYNPVNIKTNQVKSL